MSATGWLLDEDRALKVKLQGLVVQDSNDSAGRPVVVRYRMPDNELADTAFPMIAIHHTALEKDAEREHRGRTALQYVPVGGSAGSWAVGDVPTSPFVVDFPIPYRIGYEIVLYTRKVLHRMQLLADLADLDRLPARFGYLEIPDGTPGTGTIRRLDLEGGPELEEITDQDGKKMFRTTYAISISSELPPVVGVQAATVLANGINLNVLYQQPIYGG